jgi:hypothetical protein
MIVPPLGIASTALKMMLVRASRRSTSLAAIGGMGFSVVLTSIETP